MSDVVDLPTFKAWARTDIGTDDNLNAAALDAATSLLGSMAGRAFSLITAADTAEEMRYAPVNACTSILWIDDAAEIVSVTENGVSLVADTDFAAKPSNHRARGSRQYRPYHRLDRLNAYWYWDELREPIVIVAKWGWASFDPLIGEAVKVLASDWAQSRNVNFGVAGLSADGFSVGMRTNSLVAAAVEAIRGPQSIGIA